jgi:hypothetical protein
MKKTRSVNVTETEPMLMSDFLKGCVKAEELEPGTSVMARITAVDSREFEQGTKGVLFLEVFNGRGLVLNQTNLKTLMAAFGRNSENWVGQDVVVNRTLADFKGKPVPAVRLEAVRRPAVTAPAVAPTPRLAQPPRRAPGRRRSPPGSPGRTLRRRRTRLLGRTHHRLRPRRRRMTGPPIPATTSSFKSQA